MSQFESPYEQQAMGAVEPPKTSALAVWALVCSIVFCCPVTTVLGVLLGIGALISIGGDPARRGKGLAVAAILLGVLFTVGQGYVGNLGFKLFQQSWELMSQKAPDTVMAGATGDVAGFRASFHGAGANASDDEIKAFFDELESRYGALQGCRFDEARQTQPQFGTPVVPMPYLLDFDSGAVPAEIELVFADEQTGQFVFKLQSITVKDPDKGDLRFP